MGWFDTMLNVATAASSAYSASQLHAMRQQNAEAALVQTILVHLREQIFRLKQMAESALTLEAESPKLAAGAISLVDLHLNNSGITPDLFPDLADKEYAMQTVRLVANNKRRLMTQLTPAEQAEVQQLVTVAQRLPDYNYYLENYNDGRRLADAENTVTQYAGRNGCLAQVGLLAYVFIGIPAIVALFFAIFSGGDWGSSTAVGPGFILGGGVGLAGLILFVRGMHAKEYKQAKKVVGELKDKIDLPRFAALDNELGSTTFVRQLQQEAESVVAAFFGESPIQAATTTTSGGSQYNPPTAPMDFPVRATPPLQPESTSLKAPPSAPDVASFGAAPDAQCSNFCSACGQPLTPGARFCMYCGTKVLSGSG